MIPLTPSLLVASASVLVGTQEEGGENRGQMVNLFLREVHLEPGFPWCAAFVHHAGHWAHYDHRHRASSWPLPATASCKELGEFAARNGVLSDLPAEGSVFLLATHATGEFHHTGIVATVDDQWATRDGDSVWMCTTIEGNTNDDGSTEGRAVLVKHRTFYKNRGDRFIDWPSLDRRGSIAA